MFNQGIYRFLGSTKELNLLGWANIPLYIYLTEYKVCYSSFQSVAEYDDSQWPDSISLGGGVTGWWLMSAMCYSVIQHGVRVTRSEVIHPIVCSSTPPPLMHQPRHRHGCHLENFTTKDQDAVAKNNLLPYTFRCQPCRIFTLFPAFRITRKISRILVLVPIFTNTTHLTRDIDQCCFYDGPTS